MCQKIKKAVQGWTAFLFPARTSGPLVPEQALPLYPSAFRLHRIFLTIGGGRFAEEVVIVKQGVLKVNSARTDNNFGQAII